jgi:hypothetical protein
LLDALDRYPGIRKSGPGLKIDDLPHHYKHRTRVLEWEEPFWRHPLGPGLFLAPIDTTFAAYRPSVDSHEIFAPAARTDAPYLARHLAWYSDLSCPTDEELFYRERARRGNGGSHWTQEKLDFAFRQQLWANRLSHWSVPRLGWRAYASVRYRFTKARAQSSKAERKRSS